MYQQGYRPDPFQKKRASSVGSKAGYQPAQPPPPGPFYSQAEPSKPSHRQKAPTGNQPPFQQPMPQGKPPAIARPSKPPKKKGGFSLAKFIVILVLIAGLSGGGYYYYVSSQVLPEGLFCHGISIDGIDMSGLTAQEGADKVYAQAQNRQQSWNVRLMYGDQTAYTITSDMLGMEIKVSDILKEAFALGRQGSVFEQKSAQDALRQNRKEFFTVVPSADTSVIDNILYEIKKNYVDKAPVDAKLLSIDPYRENPFVYQAEVRGRRLDIEPLKQHIYEMVAKMETGELQIEPEMIEPKVLLSHLYEQTALRGEAITLIAKESTENRTENIRIAFGKINGKTLDAGDRFSFNGIVGVRDPKYGFLSAIEYTYGESVMGVGGGVCQASTTLYQAALKAGLEITERRPHSDSVGYAQYGQDATVSSVKGHEKDFAFKNTSGGKIYIICAVETSPSNKKQLICRVRIFGPSLGDISYKIESETVERLYSKEIKEVKDTTQTHVTYVGERKWKANAKEGCVVDTYLCTIQGNVVIERKKISRDTYAAKPEQWWVGTVKR